MLKRTLQTLNEDSTQSDFFRTAAWCLLNTKYSNGGINEAAAVVMTEQDCSIPRSEAREYVEMVISEAEDMEWEG